MMEEKDRQSSRLSGAWKKHDRRWKENRYVYAVISRRSRGISIGINLSPGKECNFNCVYCQVNRTIPPQTRKVDLDLLVEELDHILRAERDGSLYADSPFNVLLGSERGIRDIAFSGDGEPTTYPRFEDAIRIAADARRQFALEATKLVLITNAAYLHKPAVLAALEILDRNNGEIWAKLDAGTDSHFLHVNRPNVSLPQILRNLLKTSQARPIVIQSLWFRTEGALPPREEVDAYCDRLNELLAAGGELKCLQLYTIARTPSESSVSALSLDELDQIASIVQSRVPVSVEVFY
jgi:wyosine [tRNA(Phe)-imidazoG37] synthetase (radical SAM superfamily)